MRFRILGQLRCAPVTPSAGKMCAVLGSLLVEAGDVVATDSLIDELWGDHPPRTATTTLHVYISHLRKLLADDDDPQGRDRLATRAPGYVLHTSPGEFDLHRFEELRRAGQEFYARHDHAAASAALHEALGLWTGPALSGVPRGSRLEAAADRLELLRLDALEQRIAADLWLGRHRQLTGELAVLAREHPLRETLHAHLMVALYRADRQSEALAAYDTVRRSLAGELGTDPGPALRELHRRMLRSEPVVHAEEEPGGRQSVTVAGAPAPVVRLPRPDGELAGRRLQLAEAEEMLRGTSADPPARVLNITGPAGSGKTAFAVGLAHATAGMFPGGRVFAALTGSDGRALTTRDALLRVLRLVRPGRDATAPGEPAGTDELSDLLRVALAERRLLLVLDHAASPAQIGPLVAAVTHGAVLVTSRGPVAAGGGSRELPLAELGPADCGDLLARAAGRRITDDVEAAERIALLCGRLPLVLRAAAATLAARPHWTAAALAGRLADEHTRLDVLSLGDPGLRPRLLAGYFELSPAGQRAFRLLASAPGPDFAPWCAAALLDTSAERAGHLLDQLVHSGLLAVSCPPGRPPRYRFQEPFRALAAGLAADESGPVVRAAQLRLCAAYLVLARYAEAAMAPGRAPSPDDAAAGPPVEVPGGLPGPGHPVGDTPLRWFQEESTALAGAVEMAYAAGEWQVTWMLAETLTGYFQAAGEWERWESASGRALEAARRAGDRAGEARVLCSQGDLAWQRHQFELAATRFARAGRRARESADRRTEARAMIGLADAEAGSGRTAQARRIYGNAALLCRLADDPRGLSDALRGQALAELRCGETESALRSFAECGRVADALGDRRWSEYARRAADAVRLALADGGPFPGDPVEVRPGVWAMDEAAAYSAPGVR
ncbi:BTAD domain-containing putative transcriptional regulator [Streptomyces sodiiphilus]|uniref:BTAD domain-containing putative transcriptional regulator n=1 Tax=Streptomyces sodiiphilus TaxID=226217 RepID=A0ABN2NX66_9ACTN